MSEFTPAISIGEYQCDLEYSVHPDGTKYWFDHLGIVETRHQMHEMLDRALDDAVSVYDLTKK